jgi:hypothetical protein
LGVCEAGQSDSLRRILQYSEGCVKLSPEKAIAKIKCLRLGKCQVNSHLLEQLGPIYAAEDAARKQNKYDEHDAATAKTRARAPLTKSEIVLKPIE